ncbi:unnamed protein product [Lampetra fluviatilis]
MTCPHSKSHGAWRCISTSSDAPTWPHAPDPPRTVDNPKTEQIFKSALPFPVQRGGRLMRVFKAAGSN